MNTEINNTEATEDLVIKDGVVEKIFNNGSEVVIPDGVREIGEYAAYLCKEIKTVIIPYSVKKIGEYAFCGCEDLEYASIPNSVESIGSGILFGTALYNNLQNWDHDVLYVDNHLVDTRNTVSGIYEIKKGTLTIAESAFMGCKQLTGIVIPDGVRRIEAFSFDGCSSLRSVTLPDSIEYISDYAFVHCKALNPEPSVQKKG